MNSAFPLLRGIMAASPPPRLPGGEGTGTRGPAGDSGDVVPRDTPIITLRRRPPAPLQPPSPSPSRKWVDQRMDEARVFLDQNLRPLRAGTLGVCALATAIWFTRTRPAGLTSLLPPLQMLRYTAVADVPSVMFAQQRRIRCTVARVDEAEPQLYLYHWPLLRRWFFASKGPATTERCLRVRPFGVTTSPEALQGMLKHGDFVTCKFLWKLPDDPDTAIVTIKRRPTFFSRRQDVSAGLLKAGQAEFVLTRVADDHVMTNRSKRSLAATVETLQAQEALARKAGAGLWKARNEAEEAKQTAAERVRLGLASAVNTVDKEAVKQAAVKAAKVSGTALVKTASVTARLAGWLWGKAKERRERKQAQAAAAAARSDASRSQAPAEPAETSSSGSEAESRTEPTDGTDNRSQ